MPRHIKIFFCIKRHVNEAKRSIQYKEPRLHVNPLIYNYPLVLRKKVAILNKVTKPTKHKQLTNDMALS